jgi:hypothetical protein
MYAIHLRLQAYNYCDPTGRSSIDPNNVPCKTSYDPAISNQPRSTTTILTVLYTAIGRFQYYFSIVGDVAKRWKKRNDDRNKRKNVWPRVPPYLSVVWLQVDCISQIFLSFDLSVFKRITNISNREIRFKIKKEYRTILPPKISLYPHNQNEYEIYPDKKGNSLWNCRHVIHL